MQLHLLLIVVRCYRLKIIKTLKRARRPTFFFVLGRFIFALLHVKFKKSVHGNIFGVYVLKQTHRAQLQLMRQKQLGRLLRYIMITILSACLRCLRDPLSLLKDRVWLKTFRKLQHSIRVEGRREKTEIGNFLNFWSPIVWKLHLEHYPLISIHSIGTKLRLGKVFGNLLRPRTRNLQMPRMYTT